MKEATENLEEARKVASRLFLENHGYVRYIAFHSVPMRNLQEDIVNDVFVEFVNKANQWDYNESIRPLLRSITRNIAMQYWKNYLRTIPSELQRVAEYLRMSMQSTEPIPGSDNVTDEVEALNQCIEKLPPKSQQLVREIYFNSKTIQEVAIETNQKPLTLGKAICRIRDSLKECITRLLGGVSCPK